MKRHVIVTLLTVVAALAVATTAYGLWRGGSSAGSRVDAASNGSVVTSASSSTSTTAMPTTATAVTTTTTTTTATPTTSASSTTATTTTTTTAPTWVTTTVSINYSGGARSYLLSRPATTSTSKLPVLIELHGFGATPQEEEDRSGFLDVTGPAILVYPAGIDGSWNAGFCCHEAQALGIDDVGFIKTVVSQVLATQPDTAPNRVYLVGYSNGGKMALRMACEAPMLFAGVASYGAVNAKPCNNPSAASLLELAATADPELTIGPDGPPQVENGYTEPTVVAQVAQYRQADACNDVTTATTQGTLTTTTWTECASGREVQLGLYQGGDHGWPDGDATTPSAAQVMWQFFQSLSTSS